MSHTLFSKKTLTLRISNYYNNITHYAKNFKRRCGFFDIGDATKPRHYFCVTHKKVWVTRKINVTHKRPIYVTHNMCVNKNKTPKKIAKTFLKWGRGFNKHLLYVLSSFSVFGIVTGRGWGGWGLNANQSKQDQQVMEWESSSLKMNIARARNKPVWKMGKVWTLSLWWGKVVYIIKFPWRARQF